MQLFSKTKLKKKNNKSAIFFFPILKCICPLFELKGFLYCEGILATLFQNRAQYLKIFVLSKVLNFILLVPLLVWFTMDLQTGHLEDRYHYFFWYFIIIIYYEVFVFFFPNQFFPNIFFFFFFFAFWHKKIRRQPVKGVLKASVKIFKKIYGSKSPFTPKFQPWKISFDRKIC